MRLFVFLFVNIIAIISLNALALKWANVFSIGLLIFVIINSLILSRAYRYVYAILISIFLIFSYITTEHLVDYFGNYKTVLENGEEIPFDFQIFSSIIILFICIILSAIIILVNRIIINRKIKLIEEDKLIEELGK